MSFWLPTPGDLSFQQRKIVNEDLTGNIFITGPAGSGKTVVGIYKMKELLSEGKTKILFLMYNHSLFGFIRNEIKNLSIQESKIETKDKYFLKLHWQVKRRLADLSNYEHGYKQSLNNLLGSQIPKYDAVLVDECQDLNFEELELLKQMSSNLIFLGDFNQSVYRNRITEEDLGDVKRFRLEKVYRYGAKILDFASRFSTDSHFLGSKDLAVEPRVNERVYLHYDRLINSMETIRNLVSKYKVEGKRVAILTLTEGQLGKWNSTVRCFSGKSNQDLREHSFHEPIGLCIVNAKGLEFDVAIVIGFDQEIERSISQKPTDLAYVCCTRARTILHFFLNERPIEMIKMKLLNINSTSDVYVINEL